MTHAKRPGDVGSRDRLVSTDQTLETARPSPHGDFHLVPRTGTLEGFAEEALRCGGADLARLDPLTRLVVDTQNTRYQITLLDPDGSRILIRGGEFFPEVTEAHLCGSSFGGCLLKSAWIGIGMRMEIHRAQRNIVTSPVRTVEIQDDLSLPGPF